MRWFIRLPRAFWWMIAVGVLLRLPLIPLIGFKQDFLFLVSWSDYLAANSPITIYADHLDLSTQFVNYPPVYLYILTGAARLYRFFFDSPFNTTTYLCLIKTITICFEILSAMFLFFWGTKQKDSQRGLWATGLYFLNPAILYVSSYYGQLDAIFATFLLLATMAYSIEKSFACGVSLACALLIKLQTLPFLPLFILLPLLQKNYKKCLSMIGGIIVGGTIILSPYLVSGQWNALYEECIHKSFAWGRFVTVGAFNLWYLHADPTTFDERIWGIFFDSNGLLQTNFILDQLTYKNTGIALFGVAFFLTLYGYAKKNDVSAVWIAAMHVALAFFLFPTQVHERYLFPYFVFAAPLSAEKGIRRRLFYGFSATYLINLMVICPLWGELRDVSAIDSTVGVLAALFNVLLYSGFLAHEYVKPICPHVRLPVTKAIAVTFLVGIGVLFMRFSYRKEEPGILYLSQLNPISVEQSWPLVPPEKRNESRTGYEQLKADLSSDGNPLQIGKTVFRYGLGAHAISRVEYEIPGMYQVFECYAGVDIESMEKYRQTPDVATVTFTVWVNDIQMHTTPLTIPTTPPRYISVPLPEKSDGTNRIKLVVDGTADGVDSDHADWGMARVKRITPYRKN